VALKGTTTDDTALPSIFRFLTNPLAILNLGVS